MTTSETAFQVLLREAVEASGLSQRKAAKQFGVQPVTLYRWLNGESYPRTWETLFKALNGLKVDSKPLIVAYEREVGARANSERWRSSSGRLDVMEARIAELERRVDSLVEQLEQDECSASRSTARGRIPGDDEESGND